jgi:serine protease Do
MGVAGTLPALAQAPATAAVQQAMPSFADVIERVKPAVVSVRVEGKTGEGRTANLERRPPDLRGFGLPDDDAFDNFFRRFRDGGDGDVAPRGERGQRPRGIAQGSGFFISADGYVVTNNHVVENGSKVEVALDDGRTLDAKVVGTDPKTDLALLKVSEGSNFPFVELAPQAPRVGDWVLAAGNPFGLGGSVTAGIVSARARDIGAGPYDDFLQIDAPVNRGNSGGPAFNQRGQVVGVNTAIASPSGGNVGIAFAVPADTVRAVVAQLKEKGHVDRGYLGAQIQGVTKDVAESVGLDKPAGAIVAGLAENGPAAKAGLKKGDIVLSVNGKAVEDARDLSRQVASLGPRTQATLGIWRDGARRDIEVSLGALPNDKVAADRSGSMDSTTTLGKLGLTLAPAKGDKTGVSIVGVEPDSPAAERGFRDGDVIAEVAGQSVTSPEDVRRALERSRADGKTSVLFLVEAQNGPRFIAVKIPTA